MSTSNINTAQSIPLNDMENKLMRFKAGISACNIFKTDNKDEAIDFILKRFQQIVDVNPWLKGSCSKGKKRQVYLNFDSKEKDATPLIFTGETPTLLNEKSEYEEILKVCEPYIVKKAFMLFNKKDKLCKLVILHLDNDHFLMMFSLSHLIADGFTFYEIFNMISKESTIYGLNVKRKEEISEAKKIIPKENSNFLFNPRMIFWAFGRAFSFKKMHIKSFTLNDDYVKKQKQIAQKEQIVPFISTNDILSSNYAQLCNSNALMMAINFRHRIPTIKKKDAGNYEDILVINKTFTNTSEKLRLLISNLKNQVPKILLPTGKSMSKSNPVLITNWAGFSKPIIIEEAHEVIHMPLYSSREITFDACIVYCPQPNKTAALLFMKDLEEKEVVSHPLFV